MKSSILVFLIVLVILIIGGYLLIFQNKETSLNPINTTPTTLSPIPTINNDDLKQGGSSYNDASGVYTFLYPSDYVLDTQDKLHIRIYKTGATQQGQTEMYDGTLLVFENIELGNKTLSSWIDENIKTTTADGTLTVIEPKTATTINNYPSFTYKTRGLGEAKYYILQKDSKSKNAVVISALVSDPQNIGYQIEVDKILSTIELLK